MTVAENPGMEAIILAGGLGTRLKSVVADLPKPMAPINGRPFLAILLDTLSDAGFTAVTLAVGYRSEAIRDCFGDRYRSLRLSYSVETEPLGTGGAMRQALARTTAPHVFVVNGDTYLQLDYQAMLAAHLDADASLTVAVCSVPDAGRYGALEIERKHIQGVFEKGRSGPGVINGGVYLLSRDLFECYSLSSIFSFETDLLMPHVSELRPLAFETTGVFIDIGVPEDYSRAQGVLSSLSEQSGRL